MRRGCAALHRVVDHRPRSETAAPPVPDRSGGGKPSTPSQHSQEVPRAPGSTGRVGQRWICGDGASCPGAERQLGGFGWNDDADERSSGRRRRTSADLPFLRRHRSARRDLKRHLLEIRVREPSRGPSRWKCEGSPPLYSTPLRVQVLRPVLSPGRSRGARALMRTPAVAAVEPIPVASW